MSESLQPSGQQHFPVLHYLPEFTQLISIELMMPSNHLILCHPLLLLPSILPSTRVFSMNQLFASGSQKFGASASSSVLQFFWFDHLAVERTPKSLFQHHSSKVSILCCSAFFRVQLSHPYRTAGKTIALTRQTFVGK